MKNIERVTNINTKINEAVNKEITKAEEMRNLAAFAAYTRVNEEYSTIIPIINSLSTNGDLMLNIVNIYHPLTLVKLKENGFEVVTNTNDTITIYW